MIHTGDCVEVMARMPADSVDAVVTDPPYGLEFMGKAWDQFKTGRSAKYSRGGQMITTEQIAERSGKGGAGPSYVQRPAMRCLTCGKQKWSGSPCKCEKPEWREDNSPLHAFQAWCEAWGREALRVTKPGGYLLAFGGTRTHHRLVCGLEDAGWIIRDELTWVYASGFPKGKANLKPAHEPIVLARKPGPLRALNIEECRIEGPAWSKQDGDSGAGFSTGKFMGAAGLGEPTQQGGLRESAAGRWPSNLLLSDPELFDVANPGVVGSGATVSSGLATRRSPGDHYSGGWPGSEDVEATYGDSGGYSRFFIVPKADRADREPVLRGQLEADTLNLSGGRRVNTSKGDGTGVREYLPRENAHPTVKPTDLMRHLVRLVTPPGGTVLDCFLGSGSTAIACELEGFPWIGIEQDAGYVAIAEARLNGVQRGLGLDVPLVGTPRNVRQGEFPANANHSDTMGQQTYRQGWGGWQGRTRRVLGSPKAKAEKPVNPTAAVWPEEVA